MQGSGTVWFVRSLLIWNPSQYPVGISELKHTDCFVISGSKVLEGVGRYVVVAVGTKSYNGRIMMGMILFAIIF